MKDKAMKKYIVELTIPSPAWPGAEVKRSRPDLDWQSRVSQNPTFYAILLETSLLNISKLSKAYRDCSLLTPLMLSQSFYGGE
jgi:hypothetical protein